MYVFCIVNVLHNVLGRRRDGLGTSVSIDNRLDNIVSKFNACKHCVTSQVGHDLHRHFLLETPDQYIMLHIFFSRCDYNNIAATSGLTFSFLCRSRFSHRHASPLSLSLFLCILPINTRNYPHTLTILSLPHPFFLFLLLHISSRLHLL